jgi:hypothetical protein
MRTALFFLSLAFAVSAASAQTPQPDNRGLGNILKPGTTVWITDFSGREERTRIDGVSADIIATTGTETRRLRTADVLRVQVRYSDSLVNGALIGAGVAVASGLLMCRMTEPWENCRDDVGPMLKIGAIGAGVGIGIDALIRGRKTIYDAAPGSTRLRAAPIVTRHTRGLQVSFSF